MKIPLLIQANPATCISPEVYILPGTWYVTGNHNTTRVFLVDPSARTEIHNSLHKDICCCLGGRSYRLEFDGGSDKSITIEAELCQ